MFTKEIIKHRFEQNNAPLYFNQLAAKEYTCSPRKGKKNKQNKDYKETRSIQFINGVSWSRSGDKKKASEHWGNVPEPKPKLLNPEAFLGGQKIRKVGMVFTPFSSS